MSANGPHTVEEAALTQQVEAASRECAALSAALPEASSIVYLLAVTVGALAGGLMLFRRAQPTLVDLI